MINFASSFQPMSRAGEARDDVVGRPGLNPLRIDQVYQVDQATMQSLRQLATRFGGNVPADANAPLRLLGSRVELGPDVRLVETPNAHDAERILREVRNATNQADYVVVTAHSHQPGNNSLVPPAWLTEFAKKCLDAGASAYIVDGPHQLRGIEIYKNKPIFYSLGNFGFQGETAEPLPWDYYERFDLPPTALAVDYYDTDPKYSEATGFISSPVWFESVIAVPVFKGRDATEIRLYPIEESQKAPRSQRGTPRLAGEAQGRAIIGRMIEMSKAFGTTIQYENGIGVWKAAPAVAASP